MVNLIITLASLAAFGITSVTANKETVKLKLDLYTGAFCDGQMSPMEKEIKENKCVDSNHPFQSFKYKLRDDHVYNRDKKECRVEVYQKSDCDGIMFLVPNFDPQNDFGPCQQDLVTQALQYPQNKDLVNFSSWKLICGEKPKSSSKPVTTSSSSVDQTFTVVQIHETKQPLVAHDLPVSVTATHVYLPAETSHINIGPQMTTLRPAETLVSVMQDQSRITESATTTLYKEETTMVSEQISYVRPTTSIISQAPDTTIDEHVVSSVTVEAETSTVSEDTTVVQPITTVVTMSESTTVSPQYTIVTTAARLHARDVTRGPVSASFVTEMDKYDITELEQDLSSAFADVVGFTGDFVEDLNRAIQEIQEDFDELDEASASD
ncbi:hypothetical protein NA57DRAFT_74528 [Rhizodiscina lignyota]|uniref:Uncharacterized protein n=1 Tax=Rhizodiscina lignyota TaxID=1504668 RepID=A0A9P4M7P7_9PEZI|nr:hypothetical protein NA57DRAFT_74528 [Rhizodiscina lignyota]